MVLLKIRNVCLRFFLAITVLAGLIYYFQYINGIIKGLLKSNGATNYYSYITRGRFHLGKKELQYLKQFEHLFYLHDIIPNKYVFGTYDDAENQLTVGNIIVYRMVNSSNQDYVRFVRDEDLRAAYGLYAIKKYLFERETWIPAHQEEFLRKWSNGKFLDCIRLNVPTRWNKSVIPDDYVNNMANFRNYLESYASTPFLFGGTLLGWYRECSFIEDTTDVDMAMKITSLDIRMLKNMENSSGFKLFWILGKVDDSLELSVYSASIKIDLFFLYEDKDSAWVGGMIVGERKKFRWIYPPISQICTGDLFGRLFHVPCNVEEVLEADYGNWRTPHPTANFTWYKSHKNVHEAGYWSENEWSDVYRVF